MEHVLPETKKNILDARPQTASFRKESQEGLEEPPKPASDDDHSASDGEGQMVEGHTLLPLEAPEAHAREWLNLFAPNECTRVIDFCMGTGMLALAAARTHMKYQGYVFSELHKSVVSQILILKVVRELILQKKDGFFTSRFLSKSRSLTGSEAPSDATTLVLGEGLQMESPGPAESAASQDVAGQDKTKQKNDDEKKESKNKRKRKSSSSSSSDSFS